MPWFRFLDDPRVTLRFRNGTCVLNFENVGGEESWAWVAYREGDYNSRIILTRAGNVAGLNAALRMQGFEVPAGAAAEKVMRAAVKCGYAEELPEEQRWREELLRARALAHVRQSGTGHEPRFSRRDRR
jgi:hypothetical protein